MATINPTKFTEYVLSEEETTIGKTFSPLNLMHLNNLRYMTAATVLNLEPSTDTNGYLDFIKQKAFLDGKLNLLDELIGD